VIIVETVGVGQDEIDVASLAHTTVVVVVPGMGDDIQAIKAGILEIADILVVNKSDLPFAERSARQLAAMAAQRSGQPIPVLQTSATSGKGVAELADAIVAVGKRKRPDPRARTRRLLQTLALDRLRQGLASLPDSEMDALADGVLSGSLDIDTALHQLIALLKQ